MIAKEMELPWRAVESMHWQMGQEDLASRANVPVFQPHLSATTKTTSSKRKLSKTPPTIGSDSSYGRAFSPSANSGAPAFTRIRRSDSSTQRSPRKRTDSKTDKTGLSPMPGVNESDFAVQTSPQHGDYPILQEPLPQSGSEHEWASIEQAQTTAGSTPRQRSASIKSDISTGAQSNVESRKHRVRKRGKR